MLILKFEQVGDWAESRPEGSNWRQERQHNRDQDPD